jgi:hypothetical protein
LLVERWLGRVLSDDDIIGIHVYSTHSAPAGPELAALRREIVAHAQEIGSRAQGVTEDEVDALVDEAFAETRDRRV